MMGLHRLSVNALIALSSSFAYAQALAAGQPGDAMQCERLQADDFSQVLDAPTQIIRTSVAAASRNMPRYCEVSGFVVPHVGFLLRLPLADWNGKLLQLGCGGHCGSTDHIVHCADSLRRGYACIVTDGGHKSGGAQALWAYENCQGQIDYFIRAAHVTALAGKAIVQRYYGVLPKQAYFMGCSAGGREAMMEAQRFPWDFDGIIAGAPSLNQTGIRMNLLWGIRALNPMAGGRLLNRSDLELVHRAVLDKCDSDDGLRDGLIGDPRQCTFEAAELQCTATRKKNCLTAEQIEGINKVYMGPVSSSGSRIILLGAMRGSELTWLDWFGSDMYSLIRGAFRYYAFDPSPGAGWEGQDFDFDRDSRRLGLADGLYAAVNPDLSAFRAAGGKLISYIGWNDAGGMPLPVVNYYEMVERIFGQAATRDFFRLFVIAGMNHCTGGDGAYAVDYLSALEAWVERGQAPERLIGFHLRLDPTKDPKELIARRLDFPLDPEIIEFSRPVYPYPKQAKYQGFGDPKDAASFGLRHPLGRISTAT